MFQGVIQLTVDTEIVFISLIVKRYMVSILT